MGEERATSIVGNAAISEGEPVERLRLAWGRSTVVDCPGVRERPGLARLYKVKLPELGLGD